MAGEGTWEEGRRMGKRGHVMGKRGAGEDREWSGEDRWWAKGEEDGLKRAGVSKRNR